MAVTLGSVKKYVSAMITYCRGRRDGPGHGFWGGYMRFGLGLDFVVVDRNNVCIAKCRKAFLFPLRLALNPVVLLVMYTGNHHYCMIKQYDIITSSNLYIRRLGRTSYYASDAYGLMQKNSFQFPYVFLCGVVASISKSMLDRKMFYSCISTSCIDD